MRNFALRSLAAFCLVGVSISPSLATQLDCPKDKLIYREDVENSVGWLHLMTDEKRTPAVVRFVFDGQRDYLDMEFEGKTERYATVSGGVGIRMRGAYPENGDNPNEHLYYAFYDLEGRVAKGQPDYFLIVQHDLFWPECEK